MRIWIDLANSPHVPFFRSLAGEFQARNHEVVWTARDFAETVPLAEAAGLEVDVVGGHGGGAISGKAGNLVQRGLALARWARGRKLDLAVSHNSYTQILAARALSLKTVTLMDYEHQPANHLAFRFASRIVVPQGFPDSALNRFGASLSKVRRYDGLKEDVYLAGFERDPHFPDQLASLGINSADVLVVVRPPASEALYHRFENELFEQLINRLAAEPDTKIVLLPRNHEQRKLYRDNRAGKLVVPTQPLDGPNLIAHSDLVISAGGTMNREAAALGVPAASIYAGAWAAIDEALVREGRLLKITTLEDIQRLRVEKKRAAATRPATNVKHQVAELILE
jgi:uncharacterized protein